MQKFKLQSFLQISGIGSASGLVYKEGLVFIISDSSSYLYEYLLAENKLNSIQLFDVGKENISKEEKFDFESIALKGKKIVIFGSGSTSKRNICINYHLVTKNIKIKNNTSHYEKLKTEALISDADLNIEGALFHDKKWYYFQRGNGLQSKNGIFIFEKQKHRINFFPITLPKLQNVEASFTDAVLFKEHIYFLATAENTNSTYYDGQILGSFVGCLSLNALQLVFIQQISDNQKFEGITLYSKSNKTISFLLCEDNDTNILESTIYKLRFNL